MKKSIFILLITVFTYSCDSINLAKSAPTIIGHEISDEDGSTMPLYGGSMSTVQVWENYIAAHNDADFEAIRNMNAEKNFRINGPRGEVIKGSDAQFEFLTQWFAENNPKWEINYLIANEYTDEKGVLQQWVTTGNDLTLNVEGSEVKVHQVSDVLIVNGKVQMFYVYERATPIAVE